MPARRNHMTDFSFSSSSLLEVKPIQHGQETPLANNSKCSQKIIAGINCMTWFKSQVYKDALGRLFQGLRGSLSGADQKPGLYLECAGSEHPQPATSHLLICTLVKTIRFLITLFLIMSEINVYGYMECVEPLAERQPIS